MKIKFLFILLLSFISASSYASHLMGGEITWRCDGSGGTIFTVKIYTDCNGVAPPGNVTLTTNATGLAGGILCNPVSSNDLSPIGFGCPTCANPMGMSNAAMENVYESDTIFLNGTPPASGWYFSYNNCCRNQSIINLAVASDNITYRSIMYPYNNETTSPCFDNSPQFAVPPNLSSCIESFTSLNYAAYDNEYDSLTYDWANAMGGFGYPTIINYATGYSFENPLPDQNINPLNIPATLDHKTGTITFQSYTAGSFVLTLQVTAYKCGQKVAEIFRDAQYVLASNCRINSSQLLNTPPDFSVSGSPVLNAIYHDTITAGERVSLIINAVDFEMQNDPLNSPQVIEVNAYSNQFSVNYTDSLNGCGVAPCATLNHTFPASPLATSAEFRWQTACAHASNFNGCIQHLTDYNFVFKANDNFCPVQGTSYQIVSITVTGPVIQQTGNNLTVSLPGANYQWYLDGTAVSGATDSVFSPVIDGHYSVIATTQDGCQMVSQVVNRTSTGTNNTIIQNWNLSVNPNPIVNNEFNLMLESPAASNALLRLIDINGKILYQNNIKVSSGRQHLLIQPGNIASGVYQVKIIAGDNVMEKKIIIP